MTSLRSDIENAIEALIDLLDIMDGDPDLEQSGDDEPDMFDSVPDYPNGADGLPDQTKPIGQYP